MDVINHDKLCVNLFKGFDFTGGHVAYVVITGTSASCPLSLSKTSTVQGTSDENNFMVGNLIMLHYKDSCRIVGQQTAEKFFK